MFSFDTFRIPFLFILLTAALWIVILINVLIKKMREKYLKISPEIELIQLSEVSRSTEIQPSITLNTSAYNTDIVTFKVLAAVYFCNALWCAIFKINPDYFQHNIEFQRVLYVLQDFFILPLTGCILPLILYFTHKKLRNFVLDVICCRAD